MEGRFQQCGGLSGGTFIFVRGPVALTAEQVQDIIDLTGQNPRAAYFLQPPVLRVLSRDY